jgi:hypothetical protein
MPWIQWSETSLILFLAYEVSFFLFVIHRTEIHVLQPVGCNLVYLGAGAINRHIAGYLSYPTVLPHRINLSL